MHRKVHVRFGEGDGWLRMLRNEQKKPRTVPTLLENPEATIRFLNQFDSDYEYRSAEYGSTWWLKGEYADINKAICEVVEKVKGRLYAELAQKIRGRDLAIASQLLARHGIHYAPSQAVVKQVSTLSQRTAERQ